MKCLLLRAAALPFCAALAGCSLFFTPVPEPEPRSPSPVREFIVGQVPGSSGTVSDPEFGDDLRIVLEQEFLAATGETCRRAALLSPGGEAEMVVMCRNAGGEWTMAPRVWGQGLQNRDNPNPAPR